MRIELVRTDHKKYSQFRASALRLKVKKIWVETKESNPEFDGLIYE